jgi:hypothetical protein
MGLINWLLGKERQPRSQVPAHSFRSENGKTFALVPANFDPDGDESDFEWSGFHIHDEHGMGLSYSEAEQHKLRIFRVAGVSHRTNALQRSDFDPGNMLQLVAEKDNPYDRNAVSVWNRSGTVMVGYVPKEKNRSIRAAMRLPGYTAIALAEHRKSDKRVSLTVLFGPMQEKSEKAVFQGLVH